MTQATPTHPVLVPTGDRTPVEFAVVDSIASAHDPETFLWIVFRHPDGSSNIHYAWTAGGPRLGDHIDRMALAAGLDAADRLKIGADNSQCSTRGRVEITAHALRPILADVTAGVHAPDEMRTALRRAFNSAAQETGQPYLRHLPPWHGVGPTLLNRAD